MDDNGILQLKNDEGFQPFPYKCTAGKWTIGYGRNIDDSPLKPSELEELGIPINTNPLELELSKEQADKLLRMDIKKYIHAVNTSFPDIIPTLDIPRRWVLYNMAFNVGMSKLRKFLKFLSALIQGNYTKAAMEMLDSSWAKQVPNRANRLALQMKTGEWIVDQQAYKAKTKQG